MDKDAKRKAESEASFGLYNSDLKYICFAFVLWLPADSLHVWDLAGVLNLSRVDGKEILPARLLPISKAAGFESGDSGGTEVLFFPLGFLFLDLAPLLLRHSAVGVETNRRPILVYGRRRYGEKDEQKTKNDA